jgi:capsid protein
MIGTGILPRADSTDKSVRQRARDAWLSFVENSDPSGQSDFYGQSLLTAATVVRSGEALVRWHIRAKESGQRVPLQCEVLEPDYLDTRKIEVTAAGNLIIQGVEFDGEGRRVAYWLFPIHPGEIGQLSVWRGAPSINRSGSTRGLLITFTALIGRARCAACRGSRRFSSACATLRIMRRPS